MSPRCFDFAKQNGWGTKNEGRGTRDEGRETRDERREKGPEINPVRNFVFNGVITE